MQRRTRMRYISVEGERRKQELAESMVLLVERSGGICEVCHDTRAVHLHHRLRRSQGGNHNIANLLHVCAFCHHEIHTNIAFSLDLGYLYRRDTAPPETRRNL